MTEEPWVPLARELAQAIHYEIYSVPSTYNASGSVLR